MAGFGQASPTDTLFTIDGNAHTVSEFSPFYNRLLKKQKSLPTKDAISEFLLFHLKLKEANHKM